jgi:ABC-type multidrug transport system permease subunit
MGREPGVLFWSFGFPILLSLALGIAFRVRGPEPTVVATLPTVPPALRAELENAKIQVKILDVDMARMELRRGRIQLLLESDPQGPNTLRYRFDPTRPEARLARATVDQILQKAAGQTAPLQTYDDTITERGSRYIDFLIPGLIAMNLMSGSMWGIGWVIVEMRVRKLLKRLLAAPMRRRDLMFSFALARMVIIPLELIFILLFARLAFDVQVAGSYLALSLVAVFGSAAFAALAIAVSSRAQNTETVSGLMNLVMLPMFVTSGVFFASTNFPVVIQPVIRALPLTAMCDGLRAVMIDGGGVSTTVPYLGILVLWMIPAFFFGLRFFRWR